MKKRINISLTDKQGIALIQFLEIINYNDEIKYLFEQTFNPKNEPEFDQVALFNAIKKIGSACSKTLPVFFNDSDTMGRRIDDMIGAVYDGVADNYGRNEKCRWNSRLLRHIK